MSGGIRMQVRSNHRARTSALAHWRLSLWAVRCMPRELGLVHPSTDQLGRAAVLNSRIAPCVLLLTCGRFSATVSAQLLDDSWMVRASLPEIETLLSCGVDGAETDAQGRLDFSSGQV